MLVGMKVNREILVRGALKLLNEVGLEQLTLRRLGSELKVQAPAVYWHFRSKEDLLDEMATLILAEGVPSLMPERSRADWTEWVTAFGKGLRSTLVSYRDGARVVGGSRLTNTEYMKVAEAVGEKLIEAGFSVRQAVVLLSTVYNYTLSFVVEEQAVFPEPGKRSPRYDLEERDALLAREGRPLMRKAGPILFDRFERRYREGLELIVQGGACQLRARETDRATSGGERRRRR